MSTTRPDDIDQLEQILSAIEHGVRSEGAAAIPDDLAAFDTPGLTAADIIRNALKDDGKDRLAAARRGMLAAKVAQTSASGKIPQDPLQRRRLLEHVIANNPRLLTMGFREGKEIADEDLESYLSALEKLDLLPKPEQST